jgi:predicted MarR family transcription regulator
MTRDTPKKPSWHLAASRLERDVAEFELALICLTESFYRIMRQSLATELHDQSISGQDNIILQTIHTRSQPKSISDLCRLLNRDDVSNVQYSVRKLLATGLIEKAEKSAKKSTTYRTTDQGASVVDHFVNLRRELVIDAIAEQVTAPNERLASAIQLAGILTGIYDQAARVMVTRGSD